MISLSRFFMALRSVGFCGGAVKSTVGGPPGRYGGGDELAASREISWPSAGRLVAAYREIAVAAVTLSSIASICLGGVRTLRSTFEPVIQRDSDA
jgi:hypothetical protein